MTGAKLVSNKEQNITCDITEVSKFFVEKGYIC